MSGLVAAVAAEFGSVQATGHCMGRDATRDETKAATLLAPREHSSQCGRGLGAGEEE